MDQLCRICHGESEENRPLYFPCKCDGSIKFIHQDFLLEWMKVSGMGAGSHKCELCGETFQFTSIYSTGDPPQLTVAEFFSGLWPMIKNTFSHVVYHGTMAIIWLIIAPLLTSWFLDISFCIVFRRNVHLFSFFDVIFRNPIK